MEFKIDDDLHQKEQEYRQALNDKLKHLSNALKCRDHEINQLNENLEVLQKDFMYNISLLRDRDKELEDNDHIIHNMKQELHHRAGEISDLKIQLADQTASFHELHKQHTQMKQHLEKNTVDREKYMDLKRQYDRSLQSWQEQMELLQSVHKRQILKLESDFHQHSTETQKQYTTTISEGKLAHSAQVQELQKALDEQTNQVKHLKQQLQESMYNNSILQKNILGLQQRINENKSVFESELGMVKENLIQEQAKWKEREEQVARYRDVIDNINTITADFAKAQGVHVSNDESNPEGTVQLVQNVLDKVGDKLINHTTLQGGEDITDQSQEIKILQQQNEILREVTKELKRKVARCEMSKNSPNTAIMKICEGKEDCDNDKKKAGDTRKDLIRAGGQSSTHRDDNKANYHSHEYRSEILIQRDAIEELLMNLNTKVEKLTKEMEEKNNAENSEESLRIRELHEKIRYLKMTMLEDLRRKFQEEGNQEGMTYDDVRIMLLEQKLELVSQRIGNAVSSENKSLLKAMENIKEDLMKQLQAERKQLESSRSVEKHTDLVRERQFNLKSEELLQNIRNEIGRLEQRIEEKLSYNLRPLERTGHTCCSVATFLPPRTLHSQANLRDIHNAQPIEFQEPEMANSNHTVQEEDPQDNVSQASSSSSIRKVWDLLRDVNPLENLALPEKLPRPTVQPVIIHEPKTRATIHTIGKPLTFKADTKQPMAEKKKLKVRNYNIRD